MTSGSSRPIRKAPRRELEQLRRTPIEARHERLRDVSSAGFAMSAKIQLLGRSLALQLLRVIRTMRIHDPSNRALLLATENLKDTVNTLWAALDGAVRLQLVDGIVYLNDTRVRIETTAMEQIRALEQELGSRRLGGLAFNRPVDTAGLKEFLALFRTPVESEEDLESLREKFQAFRALALEVLDPATLSDGLQEAQALRVDRRTFGLQTYAKAVIAVREFILALRASRDPSVSVLPITRIVQDLIDVATERINFVLKLAAIKTADAYAFNHAANTCVLSIAIGKALRIDRISLVDLGTSALLADVGFALIPRELTEHHHELDESERSVVLAEMLRQVRVLLAHGQVGDAVMRRAIVAFEHHLPYRDPATGQPTDLHVFSRIVAVADAFDALTTKRPWREGYTADEALRILHEQAGIRFDPVAVRVLTNLMGVYPLGTVVRLESRELGIVYHNSNEPEFFEKPWVKVLRDAYGRPVVRTVIRNLADAESPGYTIAGIVSRSELGDVDAGMAILL